MDKFEKIWEEIKENYKDRKLELFLMLLFVIAAAGLSMDDIAKARAVSETSAEPESGIETGVPDTGWETETSAWTELSSSEDMTETASEAETADETENAAEDGTENETEAETENKTEKSEEMPVVWLLEYHTIKDTRELRGYELPPLPEDAMKPRLEDLLEEHIAPYDGDWSVYVKNLTTGEEAVVNDRPMKSASVMKLFIMGAVYKEIENGELERTDEIMALMNDMISYSDNTDSNRLLYYLGNSDYARGIERVNEFIDEYGFSGMTVEYNGFNDPETNTRSDSFNQVAARDCGRLLEEIYRRELVNRKVSNEIEQMMLNQNTRYKIPAGLPEGVLCGNKSGEMDTTENDAAIIYGNRCDYILVVLSSDWNSKDEAVSRIRSVSSQVYEYFEQ